MNTWSTRFSLICDDYYENYFESTEIRKNAGKTKFTFSQGIECGIVRSNFSPFNMNILLLGVRKRKKVTGEWRKLFRNLYSSPGHVACMGKGRKVYKVLVGKPEGILTTWKAKA
jgi:hypothetical protein